MVGRGDGVFPAVSATAAEIPRLTLDLQAPGTPLSPTLYGLMTEEINHSYDGGLYAELIQNRTFKNAPAPAHWSVWPQGAGNASMALDESQPINAALTTCLKLEVGTGTRDRVGVANDGFWGIPVKPGTTYRASFYAKKAGDGAGALTVSLEGNNGTLYAQTEIAALIDQWRSYAVTLTTSDSIAASADTRFVISTKNPGTYWFNLVSLFPPTRNDRPNGNRKDLMQLLVDMKPTFLRCPGGNYLEGSTIANQFDWQNTLHDLSQRPGHPGPWGYRSSDGLGLLEFMEWSEDMRAQPVLAVFAGYALNRTYIPAGPELQRFVQEALDEIEYVIGDPSIPWGAQWVKDGHPVPFPLTYVEIGNEDWFDKSNSYDSRFAQFYDAIKKKYSQLQLIATAGVKSRLPDLIDEHYYRNAWQMQDDARHYDSYQRTGPKIFVGEWATREGEPTTNLNAALGDAAWMTGMEHNSDVVVMSCYTPLFVNVNPGGMQWKSNLIGYDALTSYGSPSYYAQKMFNTYLGDTVVATGSENIPTQTWQPPTPKDHAAPPAKQVPTLFFVATRNSRSGTIYLKVVNTVGTAQAVNIELKGVSAVAAEGTAVVLTSDSPKDTNSLAEPTKVVPVTIKISGLGTRFTQTFAPFSVTVLQVESK